jgi:hypothetical protein
MIDIWLQLAKSFFDARKVRWAHLPRKIEVAEKVAGKRVDWSIDYEHPEKLAVTVDDLKDINEIISQHPNLE